MHGPDAGVFPYDLLRHLRGFPFSRDYEHTAVHHKREGETREAILFVFVQFIAHVAVESLSMLVAARRHGHWLAAIRL
jgi:hypothetical protein